MKKRKKILIICLVVAVPLLLIGGCFAVTFPLSVNMVFGTNFSHSLQKEIKAARELNHLAEFPQTATDIKGYDWTTFFSGDVYIKFSAPQEDINAFIQKSPGLADVQPVQLTKDHQLFYCFEGLSWFNPDLENSMVYEIENSFGSVAVDNKNNTVYILAILD